MNNMAITETSGKTYDVAEYGRLDAFLNQQQDEMDKIDREDSFQNKKVLRYALILTGVALSLFAFKYLISKRK
jgi:hypothetical protein